VSSLRAQRGEFWRVHGAILLAAARELGVEEGSSSPTRATPRAGPLARAA
jgi:hypothetical protein